MLNYRGFCIGTPSFFIIFRLIFGIRELWSNETGKRSLSKDDQQGRIYVQFNFQKDWISRC